MYDHGDCGPYAEGRSQWSLSSEYFFMLGRPMPAPKPRLRILSGAVEYPACMAFSTSGIPGPVSARTRVISSGTDGDGDLTAVGVDDHVDLPFVHGDGRFAHDFRRDPKLFELGFLRCCWPPRRG